MMALLVLSVRKMKVLRYLRRLLVVDLQLMCC